MFLLRYGLAVTLSHFVQGHLLYQRGLAYGVKLHNQGADNFLDALFNAGNNLCHSLIRGGAVHNGIHNGRQERSGVESRRFFQQQLVNLIHHRLIPHGRLVPEQFP